MYTRPLHLYLMNCQEVIRDISHDHVFAGYCPLVIALNSAHLQPGQPEQVDIAVCQEQFQPSHMLNSKDIIAGLSLGVVRTMEMDDEKFCFYEGREGNHQFISRFRQFTMNIQNRRYNRVAGNVFLKGNLYTQVQIAYCVPRNISLIVVGGESHINVFPTDLHGGLGDKFYISSLRKEGKACKQVLDAGRLAIFEMDPGSFKAVYALGKNHMRELKDPEEFNLTSQKTRKFNLPIPYGAVHYRELEVADHFAHGIHEFFLYRVVSNELLSVGPGSLAHVHNVYATWRYKQGFPGNYLMR